MKNMASFKDKPVTYFWKTWEFHANNGSQFWEFRLPDELKDSILSESDWEKQEGKDFLAAMDQAFVFNKKENPNSADKILRFHHQIAQAQNDNTLFEQNQISQSPTVQIDDALLKGFSFYETLQEADGSWAGDYSGPLFLLPGLVIASYLTDSPFEKPLQVLLKRGIWNHQNPDGGWGIHIEGKSTLFGTVMQYVTLRILGEDLSNPKIQRAQKWILDNGGATQLPQWGKFYLSLLNCYEWNGNDALLPELWLLPKWFPLHPGKYWCHNRMIFLPMSYCFANRIKAPESKLIKDLRDELYLIEYNEIDWNKARSEICPKDVFKPVSNWYRFFARFINGYEKISSKRWRKKSLDFVNNYIDHEDIHTNFINIGPINQALNSICVWHREGKNSNKFKKHLERWKDYLWIAEDGAKMNGYNSSQLWDTAFAGQALIEVKMEANFPKMANKIYQYLDRTQIDRNPKDYSKYFRDATLGCWPFSTNEQAWAVTDCTSEALKTILLFNQRENLIQQTKIEEKRLKPAIDWLLSMQNANGGWASYEKSRAPKWIEVFNPAVIFENIMTEITYVECSSATIQGLNEFSKHYSYRKEDIENAIERGGKFILSEQKEDGSWYGSWGVCFTYGTWFGIEGLLACGYAGYDKEVSSPIQKACQFLVSKQRKDGSWGENFESCVQHQYIEHQQGQIINTAWALLALLKADYPNSDVIEKGIQFLISKQEPNGDFPQEAISGVFNGNCMETYTSYRNIFPLWALARYKRHLEEIKHSLSIL